MRRLQILGATFFVALTVSAVSAIPVLANPVWLAGGKIISEAEGALVVKMAGLLELTDSETSFGAMTVKCEDVFDGTVGPNRESAIEALLNLGGELINEFGEAPELPLKCQSVAGCEKSSEAEVWPLHLYPSGWKSQLETMASEPELLNHIFASGFAKEPGYEMRCLVSGASQSDFCEGLTSAKVENIPAEKDVLEIFNPAAPISSQKGTCELGGTGSGELHDEYLIFLESGLELSVGPAWGIEGKPIAETEGPLAVNMEGSLELANANAPIIKTKASVSCKVIFVGTVGPVLKDEISEVLNASKESISSTPLSGKSLSCTDVHDCESSKVWPVNLPWLAELELMASSPEFLDYFPAGEKSTFGWYIECTLLGVKASEECTGPTSSKIENVGEGDVLAVFSPETPISSERTTCSGNKEATGEIHGELLISATSGKELSAL